MTSFLSSIVDLDKPLALYSIPVIWVTSFYPHLLKFSKIDKLLGFNNLAPRSNEAKNLSGKVPKDTQAQIARMEGAHQNGTENLPLWFAAVLAGTFAGLDNQWLNTVALSYVGVRVAYNTTYIYFNDVANGFLRTGLYFFGLSYPLRVLYHAATKVASQ